MAFPRSERTVNTDSDAFIVPGYVVRSGRNLPVNLTPDLTLNELAWSYTPIAFGRGSVSSMGFLGSLASTAIAIVSALTPLLVSQASRFCGR